MYEYQNVTTDAYIRLCENISGRNLQPFFYQWLYFAGIPELFLQWEQQDNLLTVQLEQRQIEPVYQFDISLRLTGTRKDTMIVLPVNLRNNTVQLYYTDYITKVEIDPENKILQSNNTPLYYIPTSTNLTRLYPNPFNDQVTIEFENDRRQEVAVEIWDINGRRITTLTNQIWGAGLHTISWQGKNHASGSYFCVLKTRDRRVVRKVLLLK
jgi:hypothetical protein